MKNKEFSYYISSPESSDSDYDNNLENYYYSMDNNKRLKIDMISLIEYNIKNFIKLDEQQINFIKKNLKNSELINIIKTYNNNYYHK